MIRRTRALAPALVGMALVAAPVLGQQLARRSSGADSASSSKPADPMAGARSARTLMRNGLDYLSYQEYERALEFFREAESRKVELTADEVKQLKEGIDRAQQGLREVANSPRKAYAKSRVGQSRPGAIATVQPPKDPEAVDAAEPVRLVAGEGETDPGGVSAAADVPPAIPQRLPQDVAPATPRRRAPRRAPRPAPAEADVAATEPDAPAIPDSKPRGEGPMRPPAPSALRDLPPLPALVARPATPPPPLTVPGTEPAPAQTANAEATAPEEPPALPPPPGEAPEAPATVAATPAITPDPATPPPSEVLPPLSGNLAEAPPADVPDSVGPPSPASVPPQTAAAPAPSTTNPPRTPATVPSDWHMPARVARVGSSLTPELRREVERVAELQDEDARRRAAQPQPQPPPEPPAPGLLTENEQPTAKLELPRAPSPTEARPLRAIPVPEEFVPLAPRNWAPTRKYWAAAATCHSPLYFQNAMLERYGHSVEQYVGPLGRYLTYPLDDPTQSNQRNQIGQPFFSAGLLALQIVALPYNMIMDPPWEAEYDLGYWRPGDRVPPDLYYLPLTGVGPPLRGANY